ncbi:adenine deaminase [Methanocaldococcus infernus ME]|uniref:Adenine deaminase n=1 Tax=Methanocaldococcus infernus (strain DSM 11812 / JCM 15783 / ME) TaxID=573063 RepID=D5VSD3_METIM|nr:adenine deaminase [Methanocaldococcus infernus]ADG13486.1 adenine deaminase [Methanocaldococcus infernus ME]
MITLKNSKIVNIFSGEILEGNVIFSNNKIIFVDYNSLLEKGKVIDLKGKYLAPTFIDGHIHIESSHLIPSEFEKLALKFGISKVVEDPHEIANVLGLEGIKFLINNPKYLDLYIMAPSCVPATELESSGAKLGVKEIEELLKLDKCLGLGEVMDYLGVINEKEELLKKIELAKKYKKAVDGHSPGLRGEDLELYLSKGIMSDHEVLDGEEALEKLRLGVKVMLRYGSVSKTINLLDGIKERDLRNVILVSDDINLEDLKRGYLINALKEAVKYVDPVKAIQMVTINPAEYFGLDIGIKPGGEASFIIFEDLESFKIDRVIIKGKFYEELNFERRDFKVKKSVNISYKKEDLKIELKGRVRVIKPIKGSLLTEELILTAEEAKALLEKNKINKIYVLERHKGLGNVGKGLIYNFLKKGVLASTYAHDSHNLIVVGNDERDIELAIKTIKEINGGFVAVHNGEVKAIKLEVAGLMSSSLERFEKEREELYNFIEGWSDFEDPFLSLSFFSLPVIPKLKITDKGLVKDMELVSLYL